jgi:hypothetical protein
LVDADHRGQPAGVDEREPAEVDDDRLGAGAEVRLDRRQHLRRRLQIKLSGHP